MMLDIAFWAQNLSSYEAAEEAIKTIFNVNVNDDLVRKVTNYIGSFVFDNDTKIAEDYIKKFDSGMITYSENKSINELYIEIDGAALNTRVANKDDSTWRENKLCLVFSSDNIRWWHNKKTGELMHQINKKEFMSYIGTSKEFKKYVYYNAIKNGLAHTKQIILLSDGATWIRSIKETLFPESQQILDFFHLSEHLYEFARVYFNNNDTKYKPWVEEHKIMFKNGQHEKVIYEIERIKNKTSNKEADSLYTYLVNNKDNINYKQYLDNGFFIGSGAIESGNKSVVQKRLKGPGMKWNINSAQAMLTLKSKYESKRWITDVVIPFKKSFGLNQ
jgi:hypothetical protein